MSEDIDVEQDDFDIQTVFSIASSKGHLPILELLKNRFNISKPIEEQSRLAKGVVDSDDTAAVLCTTENATENAFRIAGF